MPRQPRGPLAHPIPANPLLPGDCWELLGSQNTKFFLSYDTASSCDLPACAVCVFPSASQGDLTKPRRRLEAMMWLSGERSHFQKGYLLLAKTPTSVTDP